MKKTVLFLLIQYICVSGFAQIKSGPMLGYSDMFEVMLWVQTENSAKVKIGYWEFEKPSEKFFTIEILTNKEHAFTAKLIADKVQPSKKYKYEVIVNNKKINFTYPLEFQTQNLWQFRTDPPNFSFAVGSCVYTNETQYDRPGIPYGKSLGIFEKISAQKPNFMIWGGDNIYFREVDWNTKTGMNHRYTDFKSKKELQPLWANVHHYAIWDDHDYGNNDSDRSFWAKNKSLEAFKDFWANPNYIFDNEAITGTFMWEDCQFFMLDNRWFRAPNELLDENKDYFGEKQLNWLIDALISSKSPFKFVVTGGQVINEAKVFENMSNYPGERRKLLERIEKNKISGVIFITGDRHHTILHKLDRTDTYPLYDFTISPITSNGAKPLEEELISKTLVPNTEVSGTQTFGILELSGKKNERVLKINVFDADGKKKWDYIINANDIKTKN